MSPDHRTYIFIIFIAIMDVALLIKVSESEDRRFGKSPVLIG